MKNIVSKLAPSCNDFQIIRDSILREILRNSILLILLIPFLLLSCTKNETSVPLINACIIFSSGDVKIIRTGAETGVLPGNSIYEGDRISTGDRSLIVIQISDRDIVRVSSNSILEIRSIANGKDVKLYLERGEVISKVSRLEKNENYMVQTPTVIAGVRGTEFSVTASVKEERVAVLKGNVAVNYIAEEKKLKTNETIAAGGNTVIIKKISDNTLIETAAITKEEQANIKKISDVEPLPDLNNIKKEELDKKQELIKKIEEDLAKELPAKDELKGARAAKIRKLISEKPKSLEQIKEVFERIDEISMYSGKVISGAIISRGEVYCVLTTDGVISISESEVRAVKILK